VELKTDTTTDAKCHCAFVLQKKANTGRQLTGATENAGVENAIRAKLQGWKMQEWKKQE